MDKKWFYVHAETPSTSNIESYVDFMSDEEIIEKLSSNRESFKVRGWNFNLYELKSTGEKIERKDILHMIK